MNEYFIEKILSLAKELKLFKRFSILYAIITGLLAGILTFHLQLVVKNFFINFSPIKIPVLGQILGREYDLFPVLTNTSIGLIIWFFFFWILSQTIDYLFERYLTWRSQKQEELEIDFTKIDQSELANSWEIQGSPILRKDGLAFTNSNSGCLIGKVSRWWLLPNNNRLNMWKNFEAKITMVFIKEFHKGNKLEENKKKVSYWKNKTEEFRNVLGIVFRAQNLEDYFMLEVWKIDNTILFRPHTRLSGNWDAPYFNSPQEYKCKEKEQEQMTFSLKVSGNIARVKIGNKKIFEWILPKLFEANLIQHSKEQEYNINNAAVLKIPFRNKIGMFGFRNYGNELALIKKLVIKPF